MRTAARAPASAKVEVCSANRPWLFPAAVGILIAVKLILVATLPLTAATNMAHDDALFVRLGSNIAAGRWLGRYDQTTLIKGPGYPLFIALCHLNGLPLKLSEHVVYIAFCVVLLIAIRPISLSAKARIILFAVLLFNPMTVDQWMNRTLREGTYPAQTGLVLACLFGAVLRWEASMRRLLPWMVGLGVCLAWFWITREEGVWIMPAVALMLCAIGVRAYRGGRGWHWLGLCAIPAAIPAAVVNSVCFANWRYYGVYEIVEVKSPQFLAAYGALCRVRHEEFNAMVPVPRAVRAEIYAVSPAFEELRPSLEGPAGRLWAAISASELPELNGEIAGGWFPFALRDAVADAGHARTAIDARDFYARLAREVNLACDSGLLPASGPRRGSLAPPWDWKYVPLVYRRGLGAAKSLARFESLDVDIAPSTGDTANLAFFQNMTGGRLAPPQTDPAQANVTDDPASFANPRIEALQLTGVFYQLVLPFAVALAIASLILQLIARGLGQVSCLLSLELATLLTIIARLATVAFLDAAFFPAINTRYLAPAYPLVLMFCVLAIADAPFAAKAILTRFAGVSPQSVR